MTTKKIFSCLSLPNTPSMSQNGHFTIISGLLSHEIKTSNLNICIYKTHKRNIPKDILIRKHNEAFIKLDERDSVIIKTLT
jgi:predicted transcriptional regulator